MSPVGEYRTGLKLLWIDYNQTILKLRKKLKEEILSVESVDWRVRQFVALKNAQLLKEFKMTQMALRKECHEDISRLQKVYSSSICNYTQSSENWNT